MAEQCNYCGRFMRAQDYGAECGTVFVCSRQEEHISADPEHWSIGSLDVAMRVAKRRAGLDPSEMHVASLYCDFVDAEWQQAFWEAFIFGRVARELVPAPPDSGSDQ